MSPEEFLKEFGHLAETEGGVSQLRSAIYQIAIRGGLVPQDATEEPARLLLQRIGGTVAPGPAWDGWNLPPGWEPCLLGHLCSRVHYGVTAKALDTPNGPRMLRITDIQNDRVNWNTVPGCDIDDSASENAALADGDLLIARTGGTIGKTYLVENLDRAAVFASYLIRAVPLSKNLSPYLKLYTGSALYWEQLRAGTAGTGLPNVSGTKLKALRVPLPPLPEQKRIVEKVDQLMALCDELEAKQKEKRAKAVSFNKSALSAVVHAPDKSKLKSAWSRVQDHFEVLYELPENVKELRQTILQLAVMGKLVRHSASPLVINAIPDSNGLPETPLPRSWQLFRLEQIASAIVDCPHSTPRYSSTGYPAIRTSDIRPGKLLLEEARRVDVTSYEERITRLKPAPGDIIYAREGTIGVAATIPEGATVCLAQRVMLTRIREELDPRFVMWAMNSPFVLEQASADSSGSTVSHVNMKAIRGFKIPCPALDEQKRISSVIERFWEVCDLLELKLAHRRDHGQRLMHAVVEGLVA